jgi:hypothetical protein
MVAVSSPTSGVRPRRAAGVPNSRGVSGDAVTMYAAMGTANICDLTSSTGRTLLEFIGKSLAYYDSRRS